MQRIAKIVYLLHPSWIRTTILKVIYKRTNPSSLELGSFEQLLQFAEEHLGLNCESIKVSENETKKTIRTIKWVYSTGTLQV